MKIIFLSVVILPAFLLPASARADDGILYGETIPGGVVVDHDVILIGRKVSIAGTVNGNVFILGNQALIEGKVDGSLVLIAQNAAIGGEVTGTVYSTALTLDLPGRASLARDLYVAAVSLTSKPGSRIGRHLYALGVDAGLNGGIGGDLHTILGPIQLYNGLMRLLGFEELTLELHFELPQGEGSSTQGSRPAPRLRLRLQGPLPAFDWESWSLGLLRNWGVLSGLGLIMLWLTRRPLEASGAPLRSRPWRTLALGLLVLVVTLNLFLLALLLVTLIFAIGLGLNAIGLWGVAAVVWILAYAGLAIALTLLWLFIVYGTKVIVSYHFISWVFDQFDLRKSRWMEVLIVFLGALLYSLLRTIPYVGWGIGLLVIAAGMGAAWTAYRHPQRLPRAAKPRRASR
jgi:cytoskeletal protein CcmA (bactofilin family)